jgi:hypothetical protein
MLLQIQHLPVDSNLPLRQVEDKGEELVKVVVLAKALLLLGLLSINLLQSLQKHEKMRLRFGVLS